MVLLGIELKTWKDTWVLSLQTRVFVRDSVLCSPELRMNLNLFCFHPPHAGIPGKSCSFQKG